MCSLQPPPTEASLVFTLSQGRNSNQAGAQTNSGTPASKTNLEKPQEVGMIPEFIWHWQS